jgi:hypothetical protein
MGDLQRNVVHLPRDGIEGYKRLTDGLAVEVDLSFPHALTLARHQLG